MTPTAAASTVADRGSGRAWTVSVSAMGALMLFGALVQYNDPDPYAWIALYLAAAAVSFDALRARSLWLAAAVLALITWAWAAALAPAAARTSFSALFQSWQMMSTEMEEGRELGGLLLVAVWVTYLAYRGYAHRRRGEDKA